MRSKLRRLAGGILGARAALLVVGWGLLTAAWVIGNPPFAAPDEADHYIRTLGVASGVVVGRPAPRARRGVTPDQITWTRQATRSVPVPAGLAAFGDCYVHDPARPASCLTGARAPGTRRQTTPVGTYQPLPYLLPAATVRLGETPQGAVRWARLPGALTALVLLGLAVALLRDPAGDPRALLGPLLATTPMALFCAGSLTGSGLEIAGAIAFGAALLRLTRSERPPVWAWGAAGTTGAVLALSRSGSLVWVLALLLVVLALDGVAGARSRLRRGGRPAALAAASVVAAIVAGRVWEAAYGPHVPLGLRAIPLGVSNGVGQLRRASGELVGGFGYLEYQLPFWVPLLWLAVVVAVGLVAYRSTSPRGRRVLLGAVAGAVLVPLALYVLVVRRTGFGLQGRHVLPLLVALPLLAGELVHRARTPLRPWMLPAATLAVALVHATAFWENARRSAVGVDGSLWFLGDARWAPPLGWGAVLVLALGGALAIASVGWSRPAPQVLRACPR